MRIIDKLKTIRDILVSVCDETYHYENKENGINRYIVWAEQGEGSSLQLDNGKVEQTIDITIDFFTYREYDEMVDIIQEKMSEAKISYTLESVQYETQVELIHYEWKVNL